MPTIFDSGAECFVNPVNCVGVSGAGLALEFKRRYPENFRSYHHWCLAGNMRPGDAMILAYTNDPKYIANVATKRHWRDPSSLAWVELACAQLVRSVKTLNIRSIAIPALGCGLGGLDWADVEPRILLAFEGVECDVQLFGPLAR